MNRTRSYKQDLLEALSDPLEAKEYLNVALEYENPEVFLLALKDVLEANNKLDTLIQVSNNENLDRAISEHNSMQLNNIRFILNNIGLKLAVDRQST